MRGERALGERVALVRGLARGCAREQRLPLQLLRGRAVARGVRLGLGQLGLQARQQPRRRLLLHGEPRCPAAQLVRDGQRRLALAGRAGQLVLDSRPFHEHLVEPRLRGGACGPLGPEQTHQRAPGALEARLPLDRGDACRLGGLARRALELRRLDAGLAGIRLCGRELGPHLLEQRRRRLAPDAEPLATAAQPVQHLHRPLALARGVGELLLGAAALGEHGVEPLLGRVPREPGRGPPFARLGETRVQRREVELREPRAQPRDLEPELLRPLGRGRLQGERPQALAYLVLEVARPLHLNRDARELQLCAMPPRLEPPEPGRLLDQRAALLGP